MQASHARRDSDGRDPNHEAAALSTEPILSPSPASLGAGEACSNCGALLAADQRYCLECGEPRGATSDFLRGGPPSVDAPTPARPPSPPAGAVPSAGQPNGGNPWLTVIAGVGVLLLAMGVGVLIGRAGSSGPKAAPAQVITVGSSAGSSGAAASGGEESFTDDWPSGTKGFTIQVQTLPEDTTVAAVSQAKTAAASTGAGAVGALREADYSSLGGTGYLIYSGVYHTHAEAQKALGPLKSKFPGAKVVEVSNASGGESGSKEGGEPSSSGPTNLNHAAPSTVLKKLSHAKGKNYSEESKNLPDVVETG